jgi:hypothetical protein
MTTTRLAHAGGILLTGLRQDKGDTKQDGRKEARDIKY